MSACDNLPYRSVEELAGKEHVQVNRTWRRTCGEGRPGDVAAGAVPANLPSPRLFITMFIIDDAMRVGARWIRFLPPLRPPPFGWSRAAAADITNHPAWSEPAIAVERLPRAGSLRPAGNN